MLQTIISMLPLILTGILTTAEIISLFMPNGNGTIKGVIDALRGVGVKDVDGK